MTARDHSTALLTFGFTERQARFLATAALHGGYFLRRQYTAFTGQAHGKNVVDFVDRLVARKFVAALRVRGGRGHIYHVHAKPLYAALGEDDNRNRRVATAAQIARKLMLLDYILSDRSLEWIATEREKVALFRNRLNIEDADLPCRIYRASHDSDGSTTRFFVDKLPIGLQPEPLTVRLVYLVTDTTGAGIDAFLCAYARLLTRVPSWSVALVCPRHIDGLRTAEMAFSRFIAASAVTESDEGREGLRWFFRIRRLVDAKDIRTLSVGDLTRFREARARYAGATYEALFAAWCVHGDAALTERDAYRNGPDSGQLITYTLPFRYDHFGSLAGLV